jgi:ABC-type uncharacterized transport system permease subunit
MPTDPLKLYWDSASLQKLMRSKKIRDRGQLAMRIQRPYATVQRSIGADWSGPVTSVSVLVAMATALNVPLSRLVRDPREVAKTGAAS